jgi:hypothetical protein
MYGRLKVLFLVLVMMAMAESLISLNKAEAAG